MPRLEVFIDTSGWANLVDKSQSYHETTAQQYHSFHQQGRKLVTTSYVITELVALLQSPLRLTRTQIISIVDSIRTSPYIEIVYIDASLDGESWQLLKKRTDKEWSLVDCTSFVIMQQRGIQEALTTDHHFAQAGFVRLLKP